MDYNNFADIPYIDDRDGATVIHGRGDALVAAVRLFLQAAGGNVRTKAILTPQGTREYRIYPDARENAPLIRPDGGALIMEGYTV